MVISIYTTSLIYLKTFAVLKYFINLQQVLEIKNTATKVPFSIDIIIKGMPEITYAFSKEGKLLSWNNNLEHIFGYSKKELDNKFVSEFINKPDKERVVEKFMAILAEGDGQDRIIEYNIQTKAGKVIPILALRSLIVVDGIDYIIGIAIDISNLKNNKTKLESHVAEIVLLKNQLQKYYQKIEKMNQAEIQLKEKIYLNAKNFSNKLIDNLPGIFYLYEKKGGAFYLKKWNENYTLDLGYQDDEILNAQPHLFFTEKEYEKAEKAIQQIFTTGSTRVEIYTTHKNGTQIPYFYQGYRFENNNKIYFMGVGIDISSRYALEKKQKLQQIEKQKAKKKSEADKRELIASALQISKTTQFIENTTKLIDDLLKKQTKTASETKIYNDLVHIRKSLKLEVTKQDNWEVFKLRFTEVHQDFFSNLKTKHPLMTKSEIKFCAYLKIHLSSSQIASIQNVTKEAIKKTRYRIRKKIKLPSKDSLENYVLKF